MCSKMNPIALALRRLGIEDHSVGYKLVSKVRPAQTADGMDYFVGTPVAVLPEKAVSFMRQFGYSLGGKETKGSFKTRKALRKTSSDHKTPVESVKRAKRVEPFEFELELESCS